MYLSPCWDSSLATIIIIDHSFHAKVDNDNQIKCPFSSHDIVVVLEQSRVPSFRKEKRDKKAFHMQSELPQLLPNTRVGRRELEAVNEVTQLFNGPSTAGTQKAFCTYCCAAAAVVLLRRRLRRLRDDDALSCFCCYQRTSFLIFWIGNFSVIHEWSGKKPESRSD